MALLVGVAVELHEKAAAVQRWKKKFKEHAVVHLLLLQFERNQLFLPQQPSSSLLHAASSHD